MRLALFTIVAICFSVAVAGADETIWHERAERDFSKSAFYKPMELMLAGFFVEEAGKETPFSLHIVLKEGIWVELKQRYIAQGIKYYGPSGTRDGKEQIIANMTLKVGQHELTVPPNALEGLLNPTLSQGLQIFGTSDGYIAVDFYGSAGERAYTCAFIFKDWKFAMRQVTRDGGAHVEVLK